MKCEIIYNIIMLNIYRMCVTFIQLIAFINVYNNMYINIQSIKFLFGVRVEMQNIMFEIVTLEKTDTSFYYKESSSQSVCIVRNIDTG